MHRHQASREAPKKLIRALPRTTNALASRRSSSSRAHSSSTKRRALSRSASSRARVSRRSASSRAHSSFMKISVAFRTARSFRTSPSRKSSSSPAAPGAARREMLSLIARWPRTSCSRSARRPARTTSEKSLRSFSQDHFGSKVSRFERSQASGDESSSLSSFSVARRGVGLEGAGGTHANERRATTTMTRTRRIVMQALQEIEAISPIMERGTNSFAGPNRLLRAMDCLLYTSPSPRDQRGSRMPSSA